MRALRPLLAFTGAWLVVTSHATIAQTPAVPDITGSWLRQGFTVGVRPSGQQGPAPPPAAPPPPLKQPYLKEWQDRIQQIREADAKGQPIATNAVACLPEGMPGMMTATFPMEILQSRGQITIIEEAYTQVRRILMDRPQKALDDLEPGFYGHSVGRWEGDTLVVDTTQFAEHKQGNAQGGLPSGPRKHLVERFNVSDDRKHLDYAIVLEDPDYLAEPVTYRSQWDYRPDLEPTGLKCDLEVARRFLSQD